MGKTLNIHLGQDDAGESFTLPLEAMRRHLIAIGGTGSGKTVLCKAIVEEFIRYRLPVIAVDMQGDLLSLAQHSDALPAGAVPVSDVTRAKYRERLDVKVWTPGSTIGIPVSFAPPMDVPNGLTAADEKLALGGIARALAEVIGKKDKKTNFAFFKALEHAHRYNIPVHNMRDFQAYFYDLPDLIGGAIDPHVSEKARRTLAASFDLVLEGPEGSLYSEGQSLDIPRLLGLRGHDCPAANGKARLSVIYLNHLEKGQQLQFLTLLFESMYRWMLTQGDAMSALLYVDEIAPICPPVKKTPPKDALLMLLRQARKYGLACLLATQTPGDLDYAAMANCTTQAIGLVRGTTPETKVKKLVSSWPDVDADALMDRIRCSSRGQFIVASDGELSGLPGPTGLQGRWLATEHKLVKPEDVAAMTTDRDREELG